MKLKKNGSLSFLDIKMNRDNKKLVASVYRKPIRNSILQPIFKFYVCSLIDTLLYRGLVYAPI